MQMRSSYYRAILFLCTSVLIAATQITVLAAPQLNKPPAAPPAAKPGAATAGPKVEFLRDIAPILDRGGCSSAACHGKFGGRGGLQLSLMTLSPEDDYDPIVHAERGRRILCTSR